MGGILKVCVCVCVRVCVCVCGFYSSVIRSLNQPESIYKNTQTSTSLFPSAWGQATYVYGRLIVKPRVTSKHPGTGLCSRANILVNVPVPTLFLNYHTIPL